MNERIAWLIGVLAAIAIGAGLYLTRNHFREPEPQPAPPVESPPAEAEPAIRHPVPQPAAVQPEQAPLPELAASDVPVREALSQAVGPDPVAKFLVPDGIVRRFVATVDNLPRKKVAMQIRAVAPTPGAFVVGGSEEDFTLSEENYARYAPFVQLVESADAKQLAALYVRFYPLMQESYEGLGYPDRYFNDRMVEVIDHLLATPEVKGPIRLTQPHVFYEFADPRLEGLSAGRKALIRMGSENAATIKRKLSALRAEIAQRRPSG